MMEEERMGGGGGGREEGKELRGQLHGGFLGSSFLALPYAGGGRPLRDDCGGIGRSAASACGHWRYAEMVHSVVTGMQEAGWYFYTISFFFFFGIIGFPPQVQFRQVALIIIFARSLKIFFSFLLPPTPPICILPHNKE